MLVNRFQPHDRDGNPLNSWMACYAGEALIQLSNKAGYFNPACVRSTGVWRYQRTAPPQHKPPGRFGDHLYISSPAPEMRPAKRPAWGQTERQKLTSLLKAWAFERPDVDPSPFIGWIGVAMICGALAWRPSIWITAQAGTGKSTLARVAQALLGTMLMPAADPTEASIRHALNDDGGIVLRAGETFRLVTTFYCTSTLVSNMGEADTSRFTLLHLRPLATLANAQWQQAAIDKAIAELAPLGPILRRYLLDRFQAIPQAIAQWKTHLATKCHAPRAQDQLGTLLAIAWLILHGVTKPTNQERDAWTEWLTAAQEETLADADACLLRLMTYRVPDWDHGIRPTVAELINWTVLSTCFRNAYQTPSWHLGC